MKWLKKIWSYFTFSQEPLSKIACTEEHTRRFERVTKSDIERLKHEKELVRHRIELEYAKIELLKHQAENLRKDKYIEH